MVADEQTHTLPAERDALEQFARFLGYRNRDAFAKALLAHLHAVQRHYAALFETRPVYVGAARPLNTSGDTDIAGERRRISSERGFVRAAEAAGMVQTLVCRRLSFAQERHCARVPR